MSILDAFNLDGKVALVTGGAKNLGLDMAIALGEAGADLVVTSRDLKSAELGAEKIRTATNRNILPLAYDQAKYEAVEQLAKQAHDWQGRVDILVNNAGIAGGAAGPGRLLSRSPEAISKVIHVNLTGLLYCCKAVGKVMVEQGGGKIINIASIAGLVGRDRRMYDRHKMVGQPVDYAASKGGVILATHDLAAYFAPKKVLVNCISPGGFSRDLPAGFEKDYCERTPLGRMGIDGSNDLKGAVLFLASSAADYITGQNIVVDGGFSIWQ